MVSVEVNGDFGSPIREHTGFDAATFQKEFLPDAQPVVFRGVARHWPAVQAVDGAGGVLAYLRHFDRGESCTVLEGAPSIRGRFFYNNDLSGFNFTRSSSTLAAVFDRLERASVQDGQPALAVQALHAAEALPGFLEENFIPLFDPSMTPRLWIGNRVVVATHHDLMCNLAICVAGRRRFTLFPPEQIENLYPGPFEFTPAGTPISMVDATDPDLARFPKFRRAMADAKKATLLPGDAIYIPYMWWHQVESLDPINVLANYWWNEASPKLRGLTPMDALLYARLAFSESSDEQRRAWKTLFDYVVFEAQIPDYLLPDKRGLRGTMSAGMKDKIKKRIVDILS